MNAPKKPIVHHLCDYFFPHSRNNYRPHLFSTTSVAVLALAIIVFEAGYLVQTKFIFLKTDFLASVLPGALVVLTNQDRAAQGVAGVTENSLLNKAAQAVAEDMAANGYFSHISPDGKDPWYWLNQVGYRYSYAGQNLAVNFSDSEMVETAWMNSPTHRSNIIKPHYTQIGFGTANGIYEGKETTFVVEFFATPVAIIGTKIAPTNAVEKTLSATTKTIVLPDDTSSEKVLGSQTSPNWFARMLASPLSILTSILTILLSIIAISFIIVLFMRGRVQHPSVIIGCIVLLVCITGSFMLSSVLTNTMQLNSGTQTATAGQF